MAKFIYKVNRKLYMCMYVCIYVNIYINMYSHIISYLHNDNTQKINITTQFTIARFLWVRNLCVAKLSISDSKFLMRLLSIHQPGLWSVSEGSPMEEGSLQDFPDDCLTTWQLSNTTKNSGGSHSPFL